jgi:hypothetical protein
MRALTAVAMLVALLLPSPAPAAPSRAVLALGDSLAVPEDSYVDVAFGHLRAPGRWRVTKLVKVARAGETTRSIVRGQLGSAVRVIRRASDIRVVTVDIGGNDGRPGLRCVLGPAIPPCSEIPGAETARACLLVPSLPPCTIRPNLLRLLRTLRHALVRDPGQEAIVLLGIPNPWSGTGWPPEAIAERALYGDDGRAACVPWDRQGLNDLFACTTGRGVRFADTRPAFAGRGAELTNIAFGDPHFNAVGSRMAGVAVVRTLRADGVAGR